MPKLSEIASNLELREEGLWVSKTLSQVSFPAEGNRHCFAVEDSSFWFQHRKNCILKLLERFPPPGTFFDIGGGNGHLAKALEDAGFETVLIEPGPEGIRNARRRGIRQVIWGTVADAGLLPGTLPAIGLFDVLEHVEEDVAFLKHLHELQPAQGRIYLTVPAFPALWSHEDKLAGHWRRYTKRSLTQALESAGYQVEFATYLFGFLVLPIWLLRVLPSRFGMERKTETEEGVRADHKMNSAVARSVLNALMRRELRKISAGKGARLGSSCLAVARK